MKTFILVVILLALSGHAFDSMTHAVQSAHVAGDMNRIDAAINAATK
jgi:hypothetical protein